LFDVHYSSSAFTFKPYSKFSASERQYLLKNVQKLELMSSRRQKSSITTYFSSLPEMWPVLAGNWVLLFSQVD
jgi:hypothetical protein